MRLAERPMHRKPISLSYAHALKPLMAQTFAVPRGMPDTMRALLAELDQDGQVGSLNKSFDTIKTLVEEGKDIEAPVRAKTPRTKD